jgi:hypothetical protein
MWEWGKKSAVFYGEVFDNVRERMTDIMNKIMRKDLYSQ